jgi:hypothetical protein
MRSSREYPDQFRYVEFIGTGGLLNRHHAKLQDAQRISTPKIDRMLEAALNAGAVGGKINGSGGGGCMFAYAHGHAGAVAEAFERQRGAAYIIQADEGTRVEEYNNRLIINVYRFIFLILRNEQFRRKAGSIASFCGENAPVLYLCILFRTRCLGYA